MRIEKTNPKTGLTTMVGGGAIDQIAHILNVQPGVVRLSLENGYTITAGGIVYHIAPAARS